ncbi:MAG TPA: hypothetical protein VK619_20170, partial [Pyrinomonadaceae bacterium]|nr:hypothetical protein [Pyrinomonadaceae bacterium]
MQEKREEAEKSSAEARPLEREFRERLRSVKSVTERRTIAGLARELSKLPADVALAALETSALIAGVSLRASIEFLRAAPAAARVLGSEEMGAWGEMGRRLAMGDAESAIAFFASGVEEMARVPESARPLVFQICARQMILSSSVALDTFRRAPQIANVVKDADLLSSILEIAAEISRRSAKHSADFLRTTEKVAARLHDFGDDEQRIAHAASSLASRFAVRAGGIAADAWSAMPVALENLDAERALRLINGVGEFIERGGGAALSVLVAGGEVMRLAPEVFEDWTKLLWTITEHGNAALVATVRSSPPFFQAIVKEMNRSRAIELARRVLEVTNEVALLDGEAALACFRSSPKALRTVSLEQFEQWAREGLSLSSANARARRSYYALETRRSNETLSAGDEGLSLDAVQNTLRLYVEALTGREVEVAPLASLPDEARIGDGRTIHLPAVVSEFNDEELDFRLYKVLAAHAAGQIEFGTHERDMQDLQAAYASIHELYSEENVDARDAFALDGYINEMEKGERALSVEEEERRERERVVSLPPGSDYRAVLALFPYRGLAQRIFGTLENGRIDRRLRRAYRGLARDLDLTREHLKRSRPAITRLPVTLVPFELLFQITLCGGALDDARHFYTQIVSELESIVADYLTAADASVADTLMATSRVYSLFQSIAADDAQKQSESTGEDSEGRGESAAAREEVESDKSTEQTRQKRDARELFNAWASSDPSGELEQLDGAERWVQQETPEQILEQGEVAFNYDEWDRELTDHRTGWCRVVEKRVRHGDRAFVEGTRERYRGVISSIRHQFQMMKPEDLQRIQNELDGDDYDLNAVIDYVIDR